MKIDLTLNFSKFSLNISHRLITNLGEFSIFCIKAIAEGLTLDKISSITNISEEIITEQLEFSRQKGYLTNDNKITDKGLRLKKILDFIEKNSGKYSFYVDCYTELATDDAIYPDDLI
ncbi:MAG: hypothetical protein RMI30_03470 [Thermodesulfovibrio sp.]|nr:hypothetical protein [Thermodesulfovibrio sp.]MDW7998496.1 hypothetical protein [Thermodesulfovibrio sp.]